MKNHELFVTKSVTDPGAYPGVGVAVSSTNTYYSALISGADGVMTALHIAWTGTPTGTFTLWGSDKATPSLADDTDWYSITSGVPTNPAGAAGKSGSKLVDEPARWKRVKYVNASGSGTLTGRATVAKQA